MRHIVKWMAVTALSLLPTSALMAQPSAAKPGKAEMAQIDLYIASATGQLEGVKAALDAGANPNQVDFIDMTPLDFAANIPIAKLLLSRGAHINTVTTKGSALTNALIGNDKLGLFLLDHGADPKAARADGSSALMNASFSGSLLSLRRMLKMHVDVNRKSDDGAAALTYAVRGNRIEAAKALLAAGARVNDTDSQKRTPLHYAALYGYPQMAQLLIAHGASVRATDATGATPLHLAARYKGDTQTIRTLLAAGASREARDAHGKRPGALAAHRGFDAAAKLLASPSGTQTAAAPKVDASAISTAIKPAIVLVQRSMKVYQQKAVCISCHHQGLGLITLARATRHQFPVDSTLYTGYVKQLTDDTNQTAPMVHAVVADPSLTKLIPPVHLGDFGYGAGYLLNAMHAAGVSANPGLADMALVVGRFQKPDGSWSGGSRGTMQHSDVTNTAMVLDVLNAYWPEENRDALEKSRAKARAWALNLKPGCDEDLAARILVLKAAGGTEEEVAAAANKLFEAQRSDGGWGLPGAAQSNAYTTGVSLYALRSAAGIPVTDEKIRRAAAFLLRTQDEDGSWYVAKAVPALNIHFSTTFPHGFDQFASFAGTCWATMGLMEMLETQTASR